MVDPATQRLFAPELGSDGDRSGTLQLLRPATWLAESFSHTDQHGTWVRLVVAEWGLDGLALVKAVAPCPEIKPGSGCIVLMKSTTTYTGSMAKLTLTGVAAPLEGTSGHPIFSEDRGDYVPMGELVPGERVRTADGWATVESLSRTWTAGTVVYNLEVEGEHRFLAGFGRVVSHNAGPSTRCNVTYTKEDIDPSKAPYSGRASGYGTPGEVLRRRDRNHQKNGEGYAPAVLDKHAYVDKGSDAAKGIRGISPNNPNEALYRDAERRLSGGPSGG